MKNLIEKIKLLRSVGFKKENIEIDILDKQITVLYGTLGNIYGAKKMVKIANEKNVLQELQGKTIQEKAYALLVITSKPFEEVKMIRTEEELIEAIERLENKVAELISLKEIETEINKKVNKLMEEKHKEYLKDLKLKILEEESGPENKYTEKKLENLKKLEGKKKLTTVMDVLRPQKINEVIGQEKAIMALLTKLGTPYPQHVIMYGPPGVGKTTAARLVLDEVKKLSYSPLEQDAPFIEVDGSTLRWDPRDMTNPLTGSVHDPIYQGAQKDFAGHGIPEPKLGLVSDANSGILFIDEIGEMDIKYQNKLLKVLEDKRVTFESAYYDSENLNIPTYIKEIFENGAPADFILIGATTKDPSKIDPAIRSRVSEIYFEPLNKKDIQKIVLNAAQKLKIKIDDEALEQISKYTIEGRKAINILADVYSTKLYEQVKKVKKSIKITKADVIRVAKINRLSVFMEKKSKEENEIGKVFGLGVSSYIGSVIEFEGKKFKAKEGKGKLRFNDTAGSMAKDSVFNAMTVAKEYTDIDVDSYDFHINIIGGGKVDGPSAGTAITVLIISLLKEKGIRQDVAITGEISINGEVKPVGGIVEKIYGAIQAGMKKVLIPEGNREDVPENITEIEICIIKNIEDALQNIS